MRDAGLPLVRLQILDVLRGRTFGGAETLVALRLTLEALDLEVTHEESPSCAWEGCGEP